ncbi:MAG: protein kinase, partial [Pirellulales bacterium]|nr:protein kinase [Pirellulales bacterium]
MTGCIAPEMLRRFLEDQLDLADEQDVTAHLELCPDCRALVDRLARRGITQWVPQSAGLPGVDQSDHPSWQAHRHAWYGLDRRRASKQLGNAKHQETAGVFPLGAVLGRYLLVEELGRGGMGVVYRAMDLRCNLPVALKTLRRVDPAGIDHLKREFRAVAELASPHLAVPDELHLVDGCWFFTMELLSGKNFIRFVRGEETARGGLRPCGGDTIDAPALHGTCLLPEAMECAAPLARLRDALGQLALGLISLHRAGKIHRDVKPTNVLVTDTGRVVLLDFGLVSDVQLLGGDGEIPLAGTLDYMSPEQLACEPVGPASDWYNTGVMIYEALTGRRPFQGDVPEQLHAKRKGPPEIRADAVSAAHAGLVELCRHLLHPDPQRRPDGEQVLARLGMELPADLVATKMQDEAPTSMVGRREELARLDEARESLRNGRTVFTLVAGASGLGKTRLAEHFLQTRFEHLPDILVLRGRCHEGEAIAFKALDGLLDGLAAYLRMLPNDRVASLLPPGCKALVRMFPALGRVGVFAQAAFQGTPPEEESIVRSEAVQALRLLLRRLGEQLDLVFFADDLQWGDLDSAAILADVLAPPHAPRLMLLTCCRSEALGGSSCVDRLLEELAEFGSAVMRVCIRLGPLADDDARSLATELLATGAEGADPKLETIVRDTGGSPFFITELVRHIRANASPRHARSPSPAADLNEVLAHRIEALPKTAQEMLELLAVAGHPLGLNEVYQTVRAGTERSLALAALRASKLVRGSGTTGRDQIEPYHDRVREAAVARLPQGLVRHWHGRLARTLEQLPAPEPELLATHFDAAGEFAKAGRYALSAADRAAGALAFERAASFYRLALAHHSMDVSEQRGVREKLGRSLAAAGFGAEAAEHLLAAARGAAGAQALELRRQAAEQLLHSGHIEEGRKAIGAALEAVGLSLPRSSVGALLSCFWQDLRLRLRGFRYRIVPPETLSDQRRLLLATCWDAGTALAMCDAVRGAGFVMRHARLALDAGEPARICRVFAQIGAMYGMKGERWRRQALGSSCEAERLAKQSDDPHALAWVYGLRTAMHMGLGDWQAAAEAARRSAELLRTRCTGVAWDAASLLAFRSIPLYYLGEIGVLREVVTDALREALRRGDRFSAAMARGGFSNLVWIAEDRPDEARRHAQAVLADWPGTAFYLQRFYAWIGSTDVDLYLRDAEAAWERIRRSWTDFRFSFHAWQQPYRTVVFHMRARAALARIDCKPRDRRLLRRMLR